jgi:hypothetical protein
MDYGMKTRAGSFSGGDYNQIKWKASLKIKRNEYSKYYEPV